MSDQERLNPVPLGAGRSALPPLSSDPIEIDRTSTTDRVASALRRAFFDGTLPPGTVLREIELSGRFSVARGTLREALRLLEAEGLVTREANRGVTVTVLEPSDLTDLLQARRIIEGGAVATRPHGDLGAAQEALTAYAAALATGDEQLVIDTHLHFHLALVAASGSRRLVRAAASILNELRLALAAADRRVHDNQAQLAAHRLLLDACAAPHPGTAVAAVENHLANAAAVLLDGHTGTPLEQKQP